MRGVLITFLCMFAFAAHAQTLALTFDDGLDPDREPRALGWNRQLLDGLSTAGIKSMMFPALSKVGGNAGKALVAEWSAAGHDIGNHTSRHRNLGSADITLAEFVGDVEEADTAFNRLPTWRPMLRFPYLKEGDTEAKRDGMRSWLRAHGYRAAPVSIDTSDWYFNEVWLQLQAPSDQPRREALLDQYIDHLLSRADYYDTLARRTLNRSPLHVMLLHVNAINAASVTRIAAAFRATGWTITSPAAAFSDPLYTMEPQVLPAGESIVWALARQSGEPGLRYPAEDSVYEEPALRTRGLIPNGSAQ